METLKDTQIASFLPNRAISLQNKSSKVSSVVHFWDAFHSHKREQALSLLWSGVGEQFSIKTLFLRSLKRWTIHVRQNNSTYTQTKKKKFKITFFCVWKSVSHWSLSDLIASKKYLPCLLEKACPNQLSVEIRGPYPTCQSKIWINDQHVPSHCKIRIPYVESFMEKVCEHRQLLLSK